MTMAETRIPGTWFGRFREALRGLQCRATCWVVGLTFAMVALACWMFVDTTRNLSARAQRQQSTQLAEVLAEAAADPMEHGDEHALDALAHRFTGPDSLLYVTFFSPAGRAVATADVDAARLRRTRVEGMNPITGSTLGTPHFVPAEGMQPAHLDVTYPINRWLGPAEPTTRATAGTPRPRLALLGYVRIGLNVERSVRELSASMDLVSGTAILIGIVTVPLGIIIVRRIVEPIDELSTVTDEFARGNLSVRSRVHRGDEIGRLAMAFNHMADLHEQNHAQLVALNSDLEDRVNRRTRQLHELASRDPLTGPLQPAALRRSAGAAALRGTPL